jgi:hypothetical protein
MKTLYIIGNGFDLWHGLPTKWEDFSKYCYSNEFDFSEYFNFKSNDNYLWTDFENDLGTFDFKNYYKDNNHVDWEDDNFRPSMMYCVEDDITEQGNNLVDTINSSFCDWINEIDIDGVQSKYQFDNEAFFISFNYTSLLTRIYNLPKDNILHIHGNVEEYDTLIIGHNKSIKIKPELDEDGNSNRTLFTASENAAAIPFGSFIKPVNNIIKTNEHLLHKLINVTKIVVLGHSLNKIDLPYFKKIQKITSNPLWQISYYTEKDKINHQSVMTEIGVPSPMFSFFRLE